MQQGQVEKRAVPRAADDTIVHPGGRPANDAVPGAATPAAVAEHASPVLSVIVPTRNESENVGPLLNRMAAAIDEPAEILFVDDSDDATGYRVRRLAELGQWGNLAIRLVHRPLGLRGGGLGGAVAEGLRRARGEWVCVMDGDLQHPPEVVAELLAAAVLQDVDVVVATRCGEDASFGALSSTRRRVSRGCATACRTALRGKLDGISDPMSGFFLVRRDKVDPDRLRPEGFKILVEILGRHPGLTIGEVGYKFSARYAGVSKASLREAGRLAAQVRRLRRSAPQQPAPQESYLYDIHGVATVASLFRLPELQAFRVRRLAGPPSIRVGAAARDERSKSRQLIDLTQVVPRLRYREGLLGSTGFAAEIEISDVVDVKVSPLVARSPHVLYTNVVEPILRWHLVKSGHALVHAACVVDDGRAYLITARTDTGKTTTMLKILDEMDVSFLSDDLVIIDATGKVLAYPKPLTISAHTLRALKRGELGLIERAFLPLQSRIHSRSGRRFAFLLTLSKLPVASINAIVQIIVPPPKYGVERLVPGVRVCGGAKFEEMFVIERSTEDSVTPLTPQEGLDTLLANCADAFGFPPYDSLERLLMSVSDDDLQARERDIIAAGIGRKEARLVRSSDMAWSTVIGERVREASSTRRARPDHLGRLVPLTDAGGANGHGSDSVPAGSHTNGHANGHTNGHANGHANGHVHRRSDGSPS